jgi:hypothetical protein
VVRKTSQGANIWSDNSVTRPGERRFGRRYTTIRKSNCSLLEGVLWYFWEENKQKQTKAKHARCMKSNETKEVLTAGRGPITNTLQINIKISNLFLINVIGLYIYLCFL